MAHSQLIGHQLIRMFSMRFSQMLMQHNPMHNRATPVHAIDQQENQPRNIFCCKNQLTDGEQHDESNANAAHIPSKTLRLALRTEVEDAEHQHPNHRHYQITWCFKLPNFQLTLNSKLLTFIY